MNKKFLPAGSRYSNTLNWLDRKIRRLPGWLSMGLIAQWESFSVIIKPRKARAIQVGSKKIVYIGHSYHSKTKSTGFLLDYLKQNYSVTVLLDESWLFGEDFYPDLSFIDQTYLAVIFFQNLPSPEKVASINNDNLIYFPMYDAVGGEGYEFWKKWRRLKIINFSSTLHKKLLRWRFESVHVKYFPPPAPFTLGDKNAVFFWQRQTSLNIEQVSRLFDKGTRIHIHRAVDPAQYYIEPTEDNKKKFDITYSEWFETRSELTELIEQKAVYIAPRQSEGIGLSFLEAMAMGRAVVAVNRPTMNEYIKNNRTGYLFDISNPKLINLKHIDRIQRQAHSYITEGYLRWEKDKRKIIDFIEKP